ncbi:hypothetical protein BVC80_1781g28 [Macleaya cordata]|uniref:Uncharacterized protein n=1 Tax=Macleaya cordata TaxID=56857 RepID=A0A200QTW7_MACCD|nr:hypothetical protein BVC80_1781g28 [Macleaya cordata]
MVKWSSAPCIFGLTSGVKQCFLLCSALLGGVGVYNVVAAVLKNQSSTNAHDNKKYEQVMEQLKLLRDENDKMRADLEHIKEFEYSPSKLNSSTTPRVRFKSLSTVEQKPEEVVVPPIRGPIDRE